MVHALKGRSSRYWGGFNYFMALHISLLCVQFCRCCVLDVRGFFLFTHALCRWLLVPLFVISQITHKGQTQHLCMSAIGLTCGLRQSAFPTIFGWMCWVSLFCWHTHTNTSARAHTHTHKSAHPAARPSVCHSSSQWRESSTEVKRQRDSERWKPVCFGASNLTA